jgi:hypothetical protein
MNDEELIITINLSYLIVSVILHIIFFSSIIFDYKCDLVKLNEKNMNSGLFIFKVNKYIRKINISILDDISSLNEQTCSSIDEHSSCSSLTSGYSFKNKQILNRTMRSFSLLLCTCLLITNWLRLGLIDFFPKLYPNLIQSSINFCIIQSFFLHVLTLFHLHLTICLRLFWHYCFTCEKSWQTITYRRILFISLFIFICLCLFTLPSISNEWASIIFDGILQICIVNYTFNYSYTFFVFTLTCLIPFIILIISHRRHINGIENRMSKTSPIDKNLNLFQDKTRFQYSSYLILIWCFINILLSIFLHIPIKHIQIRTMVYYTQLISFLLEPILYIFVFRSLSIIILLRPTNQTYFI